MFIWLDYQTILMQADIVNDPLNPASMTLLLCDVDDKRMNIF